MKFYAAFATICLLASASLAQTATTKPATAPAVDPAVKKILDAMEAAGKTTKTIRADLTYLAVNTSMGDREYRTGWVAYQSKQTVKTGEANASRAEARRSERSRRPSVQSAGSSLAPNR